MAEWSVDRSAFGIVFGIAQAGILIGAAILGYLADRFGRRPVVINGVFLFGIMSLAVPFAMSVAQLAAIRFIASCTLGGVKPVLYALSIESAPKPMRSAVVAIAYAGVSIGQLVAGLVAGLVIEGHGWRSVFYISAAAPLLAAAVLYLFLPESIRFLSFRPARRAELVAQLRRADPHGRFDPDARYELRDEGGGTADTRPFTPAQLFEGHLLRLTSLIWICEICASIFTFLFYTWTPTLARGLGAAEADASYAMAAFSAGAVLGPLLISWLIDRRGGHWIFVAVAAGTAYMAGLSLLPLAGASILAAFFLIGLFSIGIQLSLAAMFMQFYPTRIRANAVGWMILIGGIGSVGSPILFGRIMEAGFSAHAIFLMSALPMACMLLPVFLLVLDYRHLAGGDAQGRRAAGAMPFLAEESL
jgi:AAHS family 4-hydroxybenzoate transporter-like MFS transporter